MKVKQIRNVSADTYTLSDVYVYNDDGDVVYTCKLLELPWKNNAQMKSCIPKGTYQLRFVDVTKKKSSIPENHLEVVNVPGRSGIKWHVANFVRQLQGCGAPGKWATDLDGDGILDVTESRKTMEGLLKLIPKSVELEIV